MTDFLKTIPAFSARLALPTSPGHTTMGYASTPGSLSSLVPPQRIPGLWLPMHEGIRSTDPAPLPSAACKCSPSLNTIRPPNQLHDPDYTMDFTLHADRHPKNDGGNFNTLHFLLKKSDDLRFLISPLSTI